jgi:DNA-directed RNA polymerase specialized sigma24 family protein
MTFKLKKRHKAIEYRTFEALTYVGEFDDLVPLDKREYGYIVDTTQIKKLIHFLPTDELEVVLLKYMGYNPKEIAALLGYSNIQKYYDINQRIRMHLFLYDILVLKN